MSIFNTKQTSLLSNGGNQLFSKILQNPSLDMTDNPNYIYIRVINVHDIKNSLIQEDKQDNQEVTLSLEISEKSSRSFMKIEKSDNVWKACEQNKLKNETHLFCYESEEIMTIKLEKSKPFWMDKEKEKDKEKTKVKSEIGYSKLVISPFVILPHTKHEVEVKMIKLDNSGQLIAQEVAAVVKLEIYYLHNFKGSIDISPIKANLTNNSADLGNMRPCIIFTLNGQRKKSIVSKDGGLFTNWEHETEKIRKIKEKESNITNEYSEEAIENSFKFELESVGHYLKIQVVNFPFFDSDAEIIGENEIRISSYNFFTKPNIEIPKSRNKSKNSKMEIAQDEDNRAVQRENKREEHFRTIPIFYNNPYTHEKEKAGEVFLRTKFNFGIDEIRNEFDSENSEDET